MEEKLYASKRSFQNAGSICDDGRFVTTEEIYQVIAEYFSQPLGKHGFSYNKSKKAFIRKTATGCDEIAITFLDFVHIM